MPGEVDDGGICSHALYATQDLGRTFVKISSHVLQFSWGDAPHADRIFLSYFTDKSKAQPRFDHWMQEINFAYTDDWHQVNDVIHGGNKFVVSHSYILVAAVSNNTLGLMVSKDAGTNFKKVVMPRHLRESSYIVLDTSEDAIVLHVHHGHGIGHIYVSDIEGVHYTLSLENNVRGSADCGFERVMNLRGIYLANVRDPSPNDFGPAPGSPAKTDDDAEPVLPDTQTQSDRAVRQLEERTARRLNWFENAGRNLREDPDKKKVRTVVSFDRGGAWTYLRAPEKDSLGQPIHCPPDSCWLHMHDITEFNRFVPFYSYTNAFGIIMGTGNVGPYLTYDPLNTNTYLSRDGGLTWMEAHKGDFIYEFGNHGGLLIMADWVRETTTAYFSADQGYSWRNMQFSVAPINVSNILTELSAMSRQFILFGTRNGKGVVYHLDFNTMGLPICQGLEQAGALSSDYERWTPSDGKSENRCLLGRQAVYARRKQLAGCLNDKNKEWPLETRNCTCTEEDFECEAGFHRGIASMTCMPDDENDFYEDEDGNSGICKLGREVVDVDAYRKVSGDTCQGGWQPQKYSLPCAKFKEEAMRKASEGIQKTLKALFPPRQPGRGRLISWPLFFKTIAVAMIVVALCCLSRSEWVRAKLMGLRIKLAGQRDYSQPSTAPPSAEQDATRMGSSAYTAPKPEELRNMA